MPIVHNSRFVLLDLERRHRDAMEAARWARLTPLERAFELIERHRPVEAWPDAELEAYCVSECQHLACLSDAQLEELAALSALDDQQRRYAEMTGQSWPL